ncbi:unnamed protein product, partial [marine sediment metagenome]
MSIGKTEVINAGLLLIGATKIIALTDATKARRLASSMFDLVLRGVYDLPINWNFATCRTELSQLSTAPDFGYDYQYELPVNFRRVIALVDEDGDEVEYKHRREVAIITSGSDEKEYDVFLSNKDEAFIKYIRLREDPNKWPGYFIKLVAID